MKFIFLVFIIGILSTCAYQIPDKQKSKPKKYLNASKKPITSRKSVDCEKLSCPALIQELICIKIKPKALKNSNDTDEIYMLLLNKCELKYIRVCNKDLEISIDEENHCGDYINLNSTAPLVRSKRSHYKKRKHKHPKAGKVGRQGIKGAPPRPPGKRPLQQTAKSKSCPKDCDGYNSGVCGRTPHGIYLTFPSACYMRAFNCEQPDNAATLVSWKSCVKGMPEFYPLKTPNRVEDANDDDIVMKFIWCRWQKSFGGHDGPC